MKQQRLIECALTRNSKHCLGKAYTKEQVNKLSAEEVTKLFSNYGVKLSGQMVKSLGKSIIKMYSIGACATLGISNRDALSEDLESDPFLNSSLQRLCVNFTTDSVRFLHLKASDLLLAGITCQNMVLKMEEQVEMTSKQLANTSKYSGLGAAIASKLMIGFGLALESS